MHPPSPDRSGDTITVLSSQAAVYDEIKNFRRKITLEIARAAIQSKRLGQSKGESLQIDLLSDFQWTSWTVVFLDFGRIARPSKIIRLMGSHEKSFVEEIYKIVHFAPVARGDDVVEPANQIQTILAAETRAVQPGFVFTVLDSQL